MAEYTILNVEARDEWHSQYGQMKDYAIQVQEAGNPSPEPGWIKLSQKLDSQPPRVGATLSGIIETKTNSNGKAYKKFRKVNPNFQGNRSGGFGDSGGRPAPSGITSEQATYIIQMLEELTGRRDVVHELGESNNHSGQLEDPFEGML